MTDSETLNNACIHLLDEVTISQIAAGEVIERPSSVVKELIENSLDADATSIDISVSKGGLKEISITDNGKGIHVADLPNTVVKHATSKIKSLDDIYQTMTMGFRGEALASMSSVAHFSISSRFYQSDNAYQLTSDYGQLSDCELVSHPIGTTVCIQDLFLKIPVRRKFLKSEAAEFSAIFDFVKQLSILHDSVAFTLKRDGVEVFSTIGCQDRKSIILTALGSSLQNHLIHVKGNRLGVYVDAWFSDPTLTFSSRSKQYFCVNSRMIQSPVLNKIVTSVFKDVIPHRRFPFIWLNVSVPQDQLDVNIHPKKEAVKFLNTDQLFKSIPSIIKQGFSKHHDIFHRPESLGDVPMSPLVMNPLSPSSNISNKPFPSSEKGDYTASDSPKVIPLGVIDSSVPSETPPLAFTQSQGPQLSEPIALSNQSPLFHKTDIQQLQQHDLDYFQLFDTYIAVKAQDKLWLLDQHAVHERILYERFKSDYQTDTQERQPLLISQSIQLDDAQFLAYDALSEALAALGIIVDDFGHHQVIIREIPSLFSDCDISSWFVSVLDAFNELDTVDLTIPELKEKLQMKACKAAIKAGKKMHPAEVKQLLHDFICSASNFTCPHGRPLFVSYEKKDLEKLFMRR